MTTYGFTIVRPFVGFDGLVYDVGAESALNSASTAAQRRTYRGLGLLTFDGQGAVEAGPAGASSDASDLTGDTLAPGVVTSSLTRVGVLELLRVLGLITASGGIRFDNTDDAGTDAPGVVRKDVAAGHGLVINMIDSPFYGLVFKDAGGNVRAYYNIGSDTWQFTSTIDSPYAQHDRVELYSAPAAVAVGHLGLGSEQQTTVGSAGGASALPATPLGYLMLYKGATKIAVPYYPAV